MGGWQNLIEFDSVFHSFYKEKTGVFNFRYMPVDLYYCFIDPYYNDWKIASVLDNKCKYRNMFAKIGQPITYFSRINNIWIDSNFNLISKEKIFALLKDIDEIVIKQANDSEGGKNIFFIKGKGNDNIVEEFIVAINLIKKDIVVQESIKQCEALKAINPSSINTIRVLSLLNQQEVKIYSTILRMGVGKSRVDNISQGGLACGIDMNGKLKEVAYNYKGEKYYRHPTTNIDFQDIEIPNYDKVHSLVKRAHPYIPNFRLVSWDIAINDDNNPLLLEANLCYGELNLHQLNNGPIFGNDTLKILKEVFERDS